MTLGQNSSPGTSHADRRWQQPLGAASVFGQAKNNTGEVAGIAVFVDYHLLLTISHLCGGCTDVLKLCDRWILAQVFL